jgi:hypothetical protein
LVLIDESDDEGSGVSRMDTDHEDWGGRGLCVELVVCFVMLALVELGSPT